jgi:hypothetical protein
MFFLKRPSHQIRFVLKWYGSKAWTRAYDALLEKSAQYSPFNFNGPLNFLCNHTKFLPIYLFLRIRLVLSPASLYFHLPIVKTFWPIRLCFSPFLVLYWWLLSPFLQSKGNRRNVSVLLWRSSCACRHLMASGSTPAAIRKQQMEA